MIPQEKSAAVTRGLREAFGVTEFEDISRITKGRTDSLVFRMIVRGSPYLLKIIVRAEDPTRHYTNMKVAAEAGLAPQIRYANTEDKVCITDFLETEPFSAPNALLRLPFFLRKLHALPPFSRAPYNTTCTFLLNKGPALDGFLAQVRALVPPSAGTGEFFARYAELAEVYQHDDSDMVSSHNDLFKPDNILFDGQCIWLVDWEAAFLNDRYADLAVVANQLVTNEAEEKAYLEAYFGEPPDEYRLARFFLMQQLTHVFYAMAFLVAGSSGTPIVWNQTVPEYSAFQRRFWAGEIELVDSERKIAYGRVHWERLMQNVRQPRFKEALRIVRERHA